MRTHFQLLRFCLSVATIPEDLLIRINYSEIDLTDPVMDEYINRHSWGHWRALTTLMQRHWFNRVWIIQEFIAAREVLILCGGTTISREDLVKASRFLGFFNVGRLVLIAEYPGYEESRLETVEHAYILSESKRRLENSSRQLHLVEFLAPGSEYEATNPRDKVYALLGLAAPGSKQ